jgi:polysaccharide pyruvyl transferase WcaK-like protein
LRKVNFVGVRDSGESLAFCRDAQLDPESFAVMGDDSFGLPAADESDVLQLLEQYGLKANEFLALNVRFAPYAIKDRQYFETIGALVDKLSSAFGMPILIVPIQVDGSDNDSVSGQKVADEARTASVCLLREDCLTAPLVKGVLGKAFGAFGVSFHLCTYALSQGVPAVCIYDGSYYTQKAEGLAAFWEDDRLAVPLKNLDVEAAARQITIVLQDQALREKLRSLSQTKIRIWREITHDKVTEIFGALVARQNSFRP